jgi:predicted transcriptional regulator
MLRRRPVCGGYTLGMKTAVSIPTALFRRADRFAKAARTSRSALYAAALEEYLVRHDTAAITASLKAWIERHGDEPLPGVIDAGLDVLRSTEWES